MKTVSIEISNRQTNIMRGDPFLTNTISENAETPVRKKNQIPRFKIPVY